MYSPKLHKSAKTGSFGYNMPNEIISFSLKYKYCMRPRYELLRLTLELRRKPVVSVKNPTRILIPH